jgi:ferredoxin-thioredoxin reductase catalytic subunit
MAEGEAKKILEARYRTLNDDAEKGGYHLNPDQEFTTALVEGLLTNKKRLGYEACPCRLAVGSVDEDRDIICPCDYRDDDLTEFGACYCGLYLTAETIAAGSNAPTIPERRPAPSNRITKSASTSQQSVGLPYPIWRCRVCGYLAARSSPPQVCPICKAAADRFEKFMS